MVSSSLLPVAAALLAVVPLAGRALDPAADRMSPSVIGDLTGGPVAVPPVPSDRTASGAVFIGYRGMDGETTGAIATVSPASGLFLRGGVEVTPRSPDGGSRVLWGLGYEEARRGSFFLHVQDWGPVRPTRSVTLRTAEASAGYKLPALRRGSLELTATPFATAPFEGGPYVGTRAVLVIAGTWFLAGSAGRTIPGVLPGSAELQRWRVAFAFGRWDGRPGGLFVTYRDELEDAKADNLSRLDRTGRGVFALGVIGSY